MSPLRRPLRALFLPATSTRRTTAKAIFAVHADARKPSLLRDSVPGARQEAPQSSALCLCKPPLRYAPSTPLIAPFHRWGTPPLALAAPAGGGQGQGVFVSKHSIAIQNRRSRPITHGNDSAQNGPFAEYNGSDHRIPGGSWAMQLSRNPGHR
jgi:hypothetical protein